MEKKRLKKIERREKIKFYIACILCFIGSGCLGLLVYDINNNNMNYEFYDMNDMYGTSNECGVVKEGTIACLVNNNFIPVKQYSKLEKGVKKSDIWK